MTLRAHRLCAARGAAPARLTQADTAQRPDRDRDLRRRWTIVPSVADTDFETELIDVNSPVNPPSSTLRVGVVGLGWAGQQHLNAYLALPGVEVVGLSDANPARLGEIADQHGIAGRFTDWRDLIAGAGIDAISVATPTFLHQPVAIGALEAGLHVLSEKPLARTGDEAQAMSDAAVKAGRVLHTAFNHRRRGDVQVLKRYVDEGRLGRVYYAKAHWLRRSGIPGLRSWFTNKEMAGGGPLLDIGVHVLDMALYLLGEPRVASVSATTYAEFGPRGRGASNSQKMQVDTAYEVEDLASAFLRLEGGRTLTLETSWAGYSGTGDSFGVALFGAEGGGVIEVANYRPDDTLRIYTDIAGAPAEIKPELPPPGLHAAVVADFVAAVRSGDWTEHTSADGLARARIIDACYASAAAGHEVPVAY
jgi:predicted dehydrogenase